MTATNDFFLWFFYGLNGLGGWFLFMLVALAAVIWLLYDSQKRRLPALGWRLGILLVAALGLPAMLYRFTVTDPTDVTAPLAPFAEPIFYLGLLGGLIPIVIAVGYYVTFQGMVSCANGHIYDAGLGQCPECPQPVAAVPAPVIAYAPAGPPVTPPLSPYPGEAPPMPAPPPRPKAQAWLVSRDGRNYQLNLGETTIGRSSQNDVQISSDNTMSRNHAKIIEQNGHFRLIDLGGKNYTRVNNHIVRQPVLLEPDDEIQLGDNTVLRFITLRR